MLVHVEMINQWGMGFGNLILTCSCGRRQTIVKNAKLFTHGLHAPCDRCGEALSHSMPPEVAERVDRALRDSTGANIDSDVNPHLAQQIARVAMQATLVPATCPHCGHELLDEERAAAARMVLSAMRSEGKR